MGNLLSRIQEIASNEGITISAMERAIGASKGVLSRAINNGTDIQAKWLQVIVENYPLYSADWLLVGKGSMLRSNLEVQSQETNSINSLVNEASIYYKMYKEEKEENKILIAENSVLKERLRVLESSMSMESTDKRSDNTGNLQKVTILSANLSKTEKIPE